MNVLTKWMNVIRTVTITWGHTLAHVMVAIHSVVMDYTVMVHIKENPLANRNTNYMYFM